MNPNLNRRQFLGRALLSGAIARTVPSFLAATCQQLQAFGDPSAIAAPTGHDVPILVVLQLAGGNDGLNTVVPFANDEYHRARPKLALERGQVLRLTDEVGLHPALTGLKSLFDDGHLGVIQSVGYPNPNRSHFRSTDIWMTASASDRVENHGWIGRYFDHACAGADPTVGIAIGRQVPLAFAAGHPFGVSLENPESLHYIEGELENGPNMKGQNGSEKYYRQFGVGSTETMDVHTTNSGSSIGSVSGSHVGHLDSPLDFLERTTADAQSSGDQIRQVAAKGRNQLSYPASRLATDLKLVARLISGGLPTRVYYVSHGGFDTHTNQLPTHQRLLTELGEATKAFLADLKAMGQLDRVLLMTFSEFGRRVAENANGGTDHGAAAPLFVAGGKVKPGVHGSAPSLAPENLLNGDVRFSTDFRSVYGTVLEKWLKTPSVPILGAVFPQLNFMA